MSAQDRLLLVLAAAVAVISVADGDWMWFIVALVGVAVVAYPIQKGDFTYNRVFLILAMIPLAVQAVLGILIFIYGRTDNLWITSLILQTWTAVVFGYMLAILIDAYTNITLSKRWILLFSLLFALTISGIYLFFQFTALYMAEYPVFNYELQGVVIAEVRVWMNMQLMMPCAVATPISIIVALVLRQCTKKIDMSEVRGAHIDG